ncbi:MAG: alpha/beta hydrolase [Anaerolineaceae bacterium]
MSHRQPQKVKINPLDLGLSSEEIQFRTKDGITLKGLWIPSKDSSHTIIFLHGYRGTYDPDLKYVPAFHQHGFNVLVFNFRAHGNSGGHYTTLGALEIRDCLAAIEYACNRGSLVIGLMGFSMGGRVALLTAPSSPKVNALISDGGPASLSTAFRSDIMHRGVPFWLATLSAFMIKLGMSICSGVNIFHLEPILKAGNLSPLPVLFIHGDKDPNTSITELEKMALAAGPNSKIWRIPEAGHRDADQFRPKEYEQVVLAFFEQWLPK